MAGTSPAMMSRKRGELEIIQMPKKRNPWDIPEWHALGREAVLVRHLVGSGVTALGRANYADKMGEYYTAFFGLSVGLERLAKLILVADHALLHNGQMPHQKIVYKFGHKLSDLMNVAEAVAPKYNLNIRFSRPTTAINTKIIACLDAFADASRGRYANFATLGDPDLGSEFEPIRKWWAEVAELILRKHYYDKRTQTLAETRAGQVDSILSGFTSVLHINETGDVMQDVLSSSIRTGQTEIVQRYGRYYALTIVRWLADLFSELSHSACYTHGIDAFFGIEEHLQTYTLDDSFLKTRKIWPLN